MTPHPKVNPASVRLLPELKGSEKQISWARALRADMLAEAEAVLEDGLALAMRTIADATWWIANRDRVPEDYRWPAEWSEAKAEVPENDLGIRHEADLEGHKHWTEGGTIKIKGVEHVIGRIALVHNPDTSTLRLFFFGRDGNLIYTAKEMHPCP